jgi:ketosteroid isomerase-like protein
MRPAVALTVTLLALILSAPPAATAATSDEIRKLEQEMNDAYAANDLAKYFGYYADDLTQWLPEGRTDLPAYKKSWSAYIGAGAKIQSVKLSDLHIQVGPSGDTAVASYLLHVATKEKDGKLTAGDYRESDVWFKRGGTWRVVFLHYSEVPKTP